MTCGTCKFWDQEMTNPDYGRCCRFPPKIIETGYRFDRGIQGDFTFTRFPVTSTFQYCGEFKKKDE